MSDKYRLESADNFPGMATIVNNETGQSVLSLFDGTPVFANLQIAESVIALLNSGVMINEQ